MVMGKLVNSLPEIFYIIIVPIKEIGRFLQPLLIIFAQRKGRGGGSHTY